MTLLQLKTSIFGDAGQSSRLADAFVARRRATEPRTEIIVRNLARDPVPHLTAERFGALLAKSEARTAEQRAVVAASDVLIAELKRADTIVLGLPMYNFGIPSVLKAYFDHIARAGVTFRYTENGPVGMLTGKKAYVFATRGGLYAGTPRDLQTAYVRDFLGFLGITDVEFVYAEGLAISDADREAALAHAAIEIDRLGTRERVAA
ncbi:MAG: NAD(P)H-dependent oxidoreductase [Betaproteobacteria bacterium]|nr:NAD(P)H-dependent oxidoreductase [Betaproteobacteria bacterium]